MADNFRYQLLKQRREFLELTCLDVVKRLYEHEPSIDISDDTLRNWEEGRTSPDASYLPVLANVLKCKVHEFYS